MIKKITDESVIWVLLLLSKVFEILIYEQLSECIEKYLRYLVGSTDLSKRVKSPLF